ncbi:unnamed protein product [Periconia digitata]|uniref:Uncharacterized protein n=1 Tax=Periconia digitata TaxID=1303443 RepID=A0A9W4UB88_9PLEO|nr:unnamed protein product [Periconia digitata]
MRCERSIDGKPSNDWLSMYSETSNQISMSRTSFSCLTGPATLLSQLVCTLRTYMYYIHYRFPFNTINCSVSTRHPSIGESLEA